MAAGFATVVGGCLLATAIFPPGHVLGRILVLAVVLAVFAAWAGDLLAGLATAVMGWLVATGFLIGREGELRFTGMPDLARLAVLVAAVAAGLGWAFVRNILAKAEPVEADHAQRGRVVAGTVISRDDAPMRPRPHGSSPTSRRALNAPPRHRV
ncbi:hypothetical protein Pth03_09260 [Planotetraspora thailandica]|uniref:DUF4118 domain-containing protein n=1 Tax=Planotetraspora thailandica TaxID=487172 RepID=A0A8J3XRX7_9ACTN|nr:hypothetical protein Pth03_09260 [Planotetraspora thailandica]